MKEIFDNYIETSFDGLEQAKFKFDQFAMNYRKYFPDDTASSVLDIGVGRGEMLSCMRDWGFDYHGIDISPSTVRFCRTLQLNCEIVDDTAAWLLRHPDEFALVTLLDVLEHVPRDQTISLLAAIRGSLRPGGKVIIQVPNLQSPYGYLHHFNDFTHVSGFVEHSLAQVLIAAGFTHFKFDGFEEICETHVTAILQKAVRNAYRRVVRFLRRLNRNPNPSILDPVFYVVACR